MSLRTVRLAAAAALAASLVACQTAQPNAAESQGATGGTSQAGTGATGTTGTGATGGTGTSIPSLVNVNLQNVLNNLSVALNIDRANIPVNAQVPIDVAANVCGVSVNVLSASVASGQGSCTATTTSPSLVQYVQQQLSASGGSQSTGATTNNMM